jgi:hypothetical protein
MELINNSYLICSICLNFSEKAVESSCCGNVFCYNCIILQNKCPLCRYTNITFNPNMTIRRIINDIPIICKNKECNFKTTIGNINNHYKECKYNLYKCSICNFEDNKNIFFEHILSSHRKEILNKFISNNNEKIWKLRYKQFNEWHEFFININILENNVISGFGEDDIGKFKIDGYKLLDKIIFNKIYNEHIVFYDINLLEKKGTWNISGYDKDETEIINLDI